MALLFLSILSSVYSQLNLEIIRNGLSKSESLEASFVELQLANYNDVNFIQFYYTANVSIGTPPFNFRLLIDTGSEVIIMQISWVVKTQCGAKCFGPNNTYNYQRSSTYSPTDLYTNITVFYIQYEEGFGLSGYVVYDIFNLGGINATVPFVNAASTSGFTSNIPIDGVLGLGYSPYVKGPLPIINILKSMGVIQRGIFSLFMNDDVYFCNHSSTLIIGAINLTYAYDINKYPFIVVNNTFNANGYWNFPALAVDYNGTNVDVNTNIFVDSGQD